MIRVGERLAKERANRGLTIEEVSKATKIRQQFLLALENGEYEKLPSSTYVQGFIKNYAEFLSLPPRETLALFRREFDEREFLGVLPESFTNPNESPLQGFRLGSTTILIILGLVFTIVFVLFQYRSAFLNPTISIISPKENATITSQVVTVIGKADPNTTVTINDIPVYIDKDGGFKKDITVFTGNTMITAKAINNFGRKNSLIRHVTIQ